METSKRSTSEKMVYLNADLLIVGEPNPVLLNEGEDFLACTPDNMDGTTGQKNDGTLLKRALQLGRN